jgi:putative FmdB family regulatory protein
MPIYEYMCRDCGERFEWLTREGEKPECPSCGQTKLTKQLSVPAAHTSGSSGPECPVRESGACGVQNCCQSDCGMADLL